MRNRTIVCLILSIIVFLSIIILFILQKKNEKSSLEYSNVKAGYTPPQILENFITEEENKHIMNMSKNRFESSKTLNGTDTNIRKSETCWLSKNNPIIKNIILRACKLTNLPFENCEDMQIVKYDKNGFYNEHHDSCCDDNEYCKKFVERGGQRAITIVCYLNNDFTGGYTEFPNLNKKYKTPKNGALLFYPLANNSNKCHPLALHKGTKIESGNKYIANIWIRERKFV